jgi:hypothetical protein
MEFSSTCFGEDDVGFEEWRAGLVKFASGFKTNDVGDFWQRLEGLTLAVFARDGGWAWQFNGDDLTVMDTSPVAYGSVEEAIGRLWVVLRKAGLLP